MAKRIIVPLDQSRISESALPLARGLATRQNIPVTLVTVLDAPGSLPDASEEPVAEQSFEPWDDPRALRGSLPTGPGSATTPISPSDMDQISGEVSDAESYLNAITETFGGVHVDFAVRYGDPGEQIIQLAATAGQRDQNVWRDDAVIVMASHGRSGLGRALMGSVAWKVVQGTQRPVFVVRARGDEDASAGQYDVERVVVALDGSPCAAHVLPIVRRWLKESMKAVHLISVVEAHRSWVTGEAETKDPDGRTDQDSAAQYLNSMAERLKAQGFSAEWELGEGDVADRVNEVAEACDADLIALATHGRSGLRRVMVGSVAEQVLHRSTRPLLVVRPADDE